MNQQEIKQNLIKEFELKRKKYLQFFDELKLHESNIKETIYKCYEYFDWDNDGDFYEEFTKFETDYLY